MSSISCIKDVLSNLALGKIYQTTDYKAVGYIKGNRPYTDKKSVNHIQDLANSMRATGWLVTSLVFMVIIKGKMFVLCGQHRSKAAELAGIPIKFIILEKYDDDRPDTINGIINSIQKDSSDAMTWPSAAHLHSWIVRGAQEYIDLKNWMDSNAVNNVELSLILMGKDNSSRAMREFEAGMFEMGNKTRAETRLNQIRELSSMGKKDKFSFVFNRNFVRAFCCVSELDEYDHDEFKRVLKLDRQNAMFIKCVDTATYKKLMEDIFNFGKQRLNKVRFV